MNKPFSTKLILVLFILVLGALVVLVTYLTLSGMGGGTRKPGESTITPTLIQEKRPVSKQPDPIPTTRSPSGLIPPSQFTGAEEPQLPQGELDLIEQKAELRSSSPLTLPFGIVKFDFTEDMFVVELKEDKASSRKLFEQWLSANYPQIPDDRFRLK